MTSTIDHVVEHLSRAFGALESVGGDVRAAKQLLELLGWDLPPGVADIGLAQLDVSAIIDRLDELTELRAQPEPSELDLAAGVAGVVAALTQAFSQLDDLAAAFQATPQYLDATGIEDRFFGRLLDVLLIGAAGVAAPAAVAVGALLGVFELTDMPADPTIFQVEHVRQTVRWDRLSTMFTDPGALLREVYGWGTPDFDGNALVTNLGSVLEFVATNSRLRALPRAVEEQLVGRSVPEADASPAAQVFVSLDQGLGPNAFDVGISLYALRPSASGATDGGLGVSPYALGTVATSFDLADRLSLVLSASEQLQGGLALLLRAGHDPQVLVTLLDEPVTGSSDAAFTLALRSAPTPGERTTLLSAPAVTIDAAAVGAGVGLEVGAELNPSLFARIEDGRILLVSDAADGFLASVLPADGITVALNLDISWSHRDGLRIHGGAGLRTTLTLHQELGPLLLETLNLALVAGGDGVVGSATVSGAVNIGPVTATVDSVGATVALRFARGNLGPVDLGAGLHPPSGIGLSIDAHGVLTGGGFLTHDAATGNYAGVMQLSLHDQITLSAYGLIATKLPDGSRGYSLLMFITAEGFNPIPLGFGFMLQAIGGMVGVHRTFDADVIAAGLKTDSLKTLLFPRDPVANAPALIQALATAFPARQGSYLLGLLARITWFTPTLVQLDLALILEFGARTRLLALGRVSALLPSRDNDLIRLNLDALGVVDFDASTLAMDALLVDSRLAHKFPITGSAALRARWSEGSGANFVLAVGGLNPRFAPPDGFPAMERVAIALCSGNNPRLICDAYLAITANTVQFGSRVSLYAEAVGFSVSGDLGFDALVTIVPPHFIVDFHAAVQLKRGSHNLFKVTLDGTLEGPLPLRLSAKATFEILWFSFSMHFDFSLAEGDGAEAVPPAVDVAGELMKVLADPASWSTRRSPLLAHGVALRSLPTDAGLVLDPLGQLLVRQQVAPLNTLREVDTYGGIPVQGARRFNVAASLNGTAGTTVTAAFAPARYFVMSDDDKLAAPSFESMDAGLLLSDEAVTFDADTIVPAPLRYETVTLNPPAAAAAAAPPPAAAVPAPASYTLPVAAFTQQRPSGAAARVPLRRAGRARFRHAAVAPAATLAAPRWRLVQTSDGAIAPDDPNLTGWAEHRAAVDTLNRDGARWLMVPEHELSA